MTKPWHLGPLCAYDLESTGLDTRVDRIVTAYVCTVLGRAEKRQRITGADLLINPGVPIPAEATKVHHVTDEMAQAKGVDPYDAVNLIAEELARALTARIPVVGHNVHYDLSMLYWECLRHGVPTIAERMGLPPAAPVGPIIDTLVLDKHVDQYRRGSRRLDDSKGPGLATHYGVPLTKAHTADADAIAAARVAVKIAEKHPDEIPSDAVQLHQVQKLWAFDQRVSLERHFRKKDPTKTLDRCWPVCTDATHPN